jgi:hypothetical protein
LLAMMAGPVEKFLRAKGQQMLADKSGDKPA